MKPKLLVFLSVFLTSGLYSQNVDEYYQVILEEGKEPKAFTEELIKDYDLIIFDDALHSAVEPFEFYTEYLEEYGGSIDFVFLETFSSTAQASIDSFLHSEAKNTSLLAGAFQQDYTYGWPYETYLTLFEKIWDINHKAPQGHKIKVAGVGQPIYWKGLNSREDYSLFQETLVTRDYFMYQAILKHMDNFTTGLKGLFLTNTRHAYKAIKNKQGQFYWNTGTFFCQWNPGKTYSIRFHNMNLYIESVRDQRNSSTQGLDRLDYRWVRMDQGKWDRAFEKYANKPVAIPFADNVFGRQPYIGNHMTNALENQTMEDAYDALIFLKPLEQTKLSAHTDFFYTQSFKTELSRRVRVINGHRLKEFLNENHAGSVDEYVESLSKYVPQKANTLVNDQ